MLLSASSVSGFPFQTLAAVYQTMATWFDALKLLIPSPPGDFQTSLASKSPMHHLRVGSQPHTTAASTANTMATLPELANGAEVAARYLRLKLPQPELMQQVVDFLVDPSASGALEWKSVTVAARYGCLDLLRVLSLSSRFNSSSCSAVLCSSDAIDFAAQYGHLEIIQWLHHQYPRSQPRCTKRAMDFAAANGHLGIVQWLHANREEGCSPRAVDLAAQNGHLRVLKWLLETHQGDDLAVSSRACKYAGVNGHLDVLRWLSSQRDLKLSTPADNTENKNKNKKSSLEEVIRKFAEYGGQTQVLHWSNTSNNKAVTV